MDSSSSLDIYIRNYFTLGLRYLEVLGLLYTRHNIVISESTLKRRLKAMNLFRRKNHSTVDELIAFLNGQLMTSGQLHGYKWMHQRCIQNGLRVQQEAVRLALNIYDSEGVDLRRRSRLRRRQYLNNGPNFLWHLDSYDKLKPYGIAVNGCIDGYSRHIMWLKACYTNSDPAVIAGYFLETVEFLKGCPKILRTDMGTENVYVEQMQLFFSEQQPFRRLIFLYGKSSANQRIEAWWSILRKHSAQFWMNIFQCLKDNGFFDGNFLDKSLIQFVFMEAVQHDLDTICLEWNSHFISSNKRSIAPKGRPFIMFEAPEIYGTKSYLSSIAQEEIDVCKEQCKYINISCDEDVHELCNLVMEENSKTISKDVHELVDLYIFLREKIGQYIDAL